MKVSKDMLRCNHLCSETDAVYHSFSRAMGLSDSEMQILYTVYANGGAILLRDIRISCGMSKQTANSALRKLEKSGDVYLETANSKSKRLYLTEKGFAFCEKTVARIIKAENDILASWSQEDVEEYIRLTERFVNDLKIKAKEICENDK